MRALERRCSVEGGCSTLQANLMSSSLLRRSRYRSRSRPFSAAATVRPEVSEL